MFDSDIQFQQEMLNGVSRTFAFTIPQLPGQLRTTVTNAYLLCRILDTIEDDPALNYQQKEHYLQEFLRIVEGKGDIAGFSAGLGALLSDVTIEAEHVLVRHTGRVIAMTHALSDRQQEILLTCLKTMTRGMRYYQKHASPTGLRDLPDLNRYCYHVAGVIGEMLTDLFCDYSPATAENRAEMTALANAFGQGLQFTNILKDLWEDHLVGKCWLPRDVFAYYGYDLQDLDPGRRSPSFEMAIREMASITCGQLKLAMDYALLIPPSEPGIRKFCIWNIGMAALTLRKIYHNPDFTAAAQVRISRGTVKQIVLFSNVFIRRNRMLRALFKYWTRGMPRKHVRLANPAFYFTQHGVSNA